MDPEENDKRIAADQEREKRLDLVFAVHTAAATQPLTPSEQADKDAKDEAAAEQAAQAVADAADAADQLTTPLKRRMAMRQWFTMKAEEGAGEIVIYDEIGKSF
jgi:hypothetical protein